MGSVAPWPLKTQTEWTRVTEQTEGDAGKKGGNTSIDQDHKNSERQTGMDHTRAFRCFILNIKGTD